MALTCDKCGGLVQSTDKFCQRCGADVVVAATSPMSRNLSYQNRRAYSYDVREPTCDTVYFSCGLFSPVIAVSFPYPDAGLSSIDLNGFSLGALFGGYRNVQGVDVGFNLWAGGDLTGLSISCLLNITKGSVKGCQIGLINMVEKDVVGVQIGMINGAANLTGMQIGVLNVNSGGAVPFFPVINVGW